MSPDEKPRFHELLSTLFGAHGKPLSEGMIAGYWKGLEKMSLPVFEKCCDAAIDRLTFAERGVSKTPTVAELWDIKRGFLGRPPQASQTMEASWVGDEWDSAANLLLLAYFDQAKGARRMDRYAPDSIYDAKVRHVVVGPQTVERTGIMVKWKNAWAQDMREDRENGGTLEGKHAWFSCMKLAEAELDRLS